MKLIMKRLEKEMALLHGTLHVTIIEAISLPELGKFEGKDTYVTIKLQETIVGRTRRTGDDPINPKWDESLHIYCAHFASHVVFSIQRSKSIIGEAFLAVMEEILNGQEVQRSLPILDGKEDAKVHVKLQFVGVNQDQNLIAGIPRTFFPQREGCKVTLYQDAHVPDNFSPEISLAGDKNYEPNRCWEDMFDAITNAQQLIYIIGWSVYTKITLIRDSNRPKPGGNVTLGQLLINKASQGVQVLILLWKDKTSRGWMGYDGIMHTHGQETASYFNGTGVNCVLCPRLGIIYTHHQKTVVVDSELGITSFLGGIDLCNGRYDTQDHSLFRTLNSEHRDDFYQGNIKGASSTSGDPRQPWHDIHCRLDGPVAWDVLDNFEQRWRKEGGDDSFLVQRKDLVECPVTSPNPNDYETWNVQLFRSIDGHAAYGFPDSPEDESTKGLVRGEDNVIIDRSIQDGYINAIRRAKNFIYIENQFFLGSSFCWRTDDDIYKNNAFHLIPKELSLKIVSKIKAGERFAVYIVLPMWPEGLPNSAPVQTILYYQRRTMEMMYSDIVVALKDEGIPAEPNDYLSFFCLGNREKPEADTDSSRASRLRFMIYVHSKMMIVDDEYIIIGSANINQRSMDGGRDTEIAMGGYQPNHVATAEQRARGQIHGFRMALWYEHLGMLEDVLLKPESVECVRKVNEIANESWELYTKGNLDDDLPGHLLRYPILIGKTNDGQVKLVPASDCFPDTEAKVLGEQRQPIFRRGLIAQFDEKFEKMC